MDWATFFAMGGYAAFVWPSYALALVLLVVNLVVTHRRERRLLEQLAARARQGEMR